MHIPKGYIYGAMGFSALVEWLNLLGQAPRVARAVWRPDAPSPRAGASAS